jgi:hypothetical protein
MTPWRTLSLSAGSAARPPRPGRRPPRLAGRGSAPGVVGVDARVDEDLLRARGLGVQPGGQRSAIAPPTRRSTTAFRHRSAPATGSGPAAAAALTKLRLPLSTVTRSARTGVRVPVRRPFVGVGAGGQHRTSRVGGRHALRLPRDGRLGTSSAGRRWPPPRRRREVRASSRRQLACRRAPAARHRRRRPWPRRAAAVLGVAAPGAHAGQQCAGQRHAAVAAVGRVAGRRGLRRHA